MLTALIIALFIVVGTMLVRALRFGSSLSSPPSPGEPSATTELDLDAAAAHLAAVIACPTVSHDSGQIETEEFNKMHRRLFEMYPMIHAHLERQVIAGHSLLYTWPGSDPTLRPILLMAHQDVVSVDPMTAAQWEQDPFNAGVVNGQVWGRGALDCKGQMIGELEAVEYLLRQGFRPQRTVYLAFGHDEEVGSVGAQAIAGWLHEQGIRLEAVLDEGGVVVEGMIPGVDGPIALIGNTEKGYLTLELSIRHPPGHAAMPPRHTAIGILARALTRLEAHPFPARLDSVLAMFEGIGTALPFGLRLVLANTWLFGRPVKRIMSRAMTTNAAIRTTTAVTMVSGGVKDNVLPAEARALVNFRLLPGDTAPGVIARVKQIIADKRVNVESWPRLGGHEAPPPSPTNSPPFKQLSATVRQVLGNIPVAPYLVAGATDARFYHPLCDNVYRFTPIVLSQKELEGVHGINEHLSLENLSKMIQFYIQLIRAWSAA